MRMNKHKARTEQGQKQHKDSKICTKMSSFLIVCKCNTASPCAGFWQITFPNYFASNSAPVDLAEVYHYISKTREGDPWLWKLSCVWEYLEHAPWAAVDLNTKEALKTTGGNEKPIMKDHILLQMYEQSIETFLKNLFEKSGSHRITVSKQIHLVMTTLLWTTSMIYFREVFYWKSTGLKVVNSSLGGSVFSHPAGDN